MNPGLFFNCLDAAQLQQLKQSVLLPHIAVNTSNMSEYKAADIALFSVNEYRGQHPEKQAENGLFEIRKAFYGLQRFSREVRLADLGELRPGNTRLETCQRLAEVCETLLRHDTLPLVIGGSHDLDYGQFMAYQHLEKIITVLNVDARADLNSHATTPAQSHVEEILSHQPNYLFEYSHLGYQRYLNAPDVLATLQKLNFELRSAGQIRDNLADTEPITSAADMLSFDICAIKQSSAPGSFSPFPFGLTAEEACQLTWYAGTSEKLTSAGFYGYNAAADPDRTTARVMAVMLWYFVEGFCHRKQEFSFKSNYHVKYIVPVSSGSASSSYLPAGELVFYKSKLSERWWIEVALAEEQENFYKRNIVLPCSYSDYEQALAGNIPDRWIKAREKLG